MIFKYFDLNSASRTNDKEWIRFTDESREVENSSKQFSHFLTSIFSLYWKYPHHNHYYSESWHDFFF